MYGFNIGTVFLGSGMRCIAINRFGTDNKVSLQWVPRLSFKLRNLYLLLLIKVSIASRNYIFSKFNQQYCYSIIQNTFFLAVNTCAVILMSNLSIPYGLVPKPCDLQNFGEL